MFEKVQGCAMVTLDKGVPARRHRLRETPAEAQRRRNLSIQWRSCYHQIRREKPSTVEVRSRWRPNHRPWWSDSWSEAKIRKDASETPNSASLELSRDKSIQTPPKTLNADAPVYRPRRDAAAAARFRIQDINDNEQWTNNEQCIYRWTCLIFQLSFVDICSLRPLFTL